MSDTGKDGEKNGGAVHACAAFGPSGDCIYQPGMSLRDCFAGQYLASGHAAKPATNEEIKVLLGDSSRAVFTEDVIAARCYRMADAMLRARANGESGDG